ncbi:lipopolysaccharide-binding protein isoform X2 [Ailuropoda melanoleuca]|uniref:lipopolysaccharide-binding protein isoform X2 n=1 Tax=Ailuropoda melanoleuca TaxID=9646 RepID=UPI0014948D7B|nr:lipopolysaccharide-binding protein isoform X2 [Ailuropoda melanoleuca]
MMARPYCVVVALLLLAVVSGFEEGASNPGFVARITRKGLEYARRFGVAILKKELSTIKLPDFSGSFKVGWIKSVSYDFYRLKIHRFELRNSDLRLRPRQGVTASLANNYVFVSGNWKVKKAFVTLDGTFDVSVDGISISVSLNLGKDQSGRPTASVARCRSSIGHISADISGRLSWILNLFHERIENNFKNILEQKICEMVRKSTTSHLEPYLRTLPVILMIDQVAGIDYSLVGAPQVTSQILDTPFKGEFFGRNWHSPAPFDAPPIRLPEKHDHMVYFAVSEYVFNTASRAYHQAGRMNFTIQNKHVPMDSPIRLHTSSFRTIVPRLARLYPNTELELEMSPESAPFLRFTPGNVTLMPVLDIQAFALLPTSSDRKPLFQLRVTTNISATISVSSDRIVGSVTTGSKLKLELKHSNVRFINVELMEAILNYYALHTIYPSLNAKLEEGFPLPLPRDTHLNSLELQVHERCPNSWDIGQRQHLDVKPGSFNISCEYQPQSFWDNSARVLLNARG